MCFQILVFGTILIILIQDIGALDKESKIAVKKDRDGKLIPVFHIVRFANTACTTETAGTGTCYTAEECRNRKGRSLGSCAGGYGVCCAFGGSCETTTSENCTVFTSENAPSAGQCKFKVCPCGDDICQLRLDFTRFVITGPSTNTKVIGRVINDQQRDPEDIFGVGRSATRKGQCLTDVFRVTSPGNNVPPNICGLNTGEHLYVEVSDCCNELLFQLGAAGVDADLVDRDWEIKITQLECSSKNLAPEGCHQYFFGSNAGVVKTFNFDAPERQHLSSQYQTFCVRRERGNCRICWSTSSDNDFELSGAQFGTSTNGAIYTTSVIDNGITKYTECCNWGVEGNNINGYDCLQVPGAQKFQPVGSSIPVSRFCGGKLVSDQGVQQAKTICSMSSPFLIRFLSDTFESILETKARLDNRGFRLNYVMDNNC